MNMKNETLPVRGSIEVICGSMFSGKTEELIRRIKRAQFAKQRVVIVKPAVDVRYSKNDVVSHDKNVIPSVPLTDINRLVEVAKGMDVVGIDEAQFFPDDLVDVAQALANNGVRVIVAGLDMDFLGKPFGPMPMLLAVAEDVTKLQAICVRCGGLAYVSHRLVPDEKQVLLGATDSYEPLCRKCYQEVVRSEKKMADLL